jgi:hypothetical protein
MIIEKTKSGLPAVWESGGGYTNTGEAIIISDANSQPKKPIYVKTSGHLANKQHALFALQKNDIVVELFRHRDDYKIKIYQFDGEKLQEIARYESGEWEGDWQKYEKVIIAAVEKSKCYHCREPHYYRS